MSLFARSLGIEVAKSRIVSAHAAIYLYAYPFNDLPVTNGTLAPFDWVVPKGTVWPR